MAAQPLAGSPGKRSLPVIAIVAAALVGACLAGGWTLLGDQRCDSLVGVQRCNTSEPLAAPAAADGGGSADAPASELEAALAAERLRADTAEDALRDAQQQLQQQSDTALQDERVRELEKAVAAAEERATGAAATLKSALEQQQQQQKQQPQQPSGAGGGGNASAPAAAPRDWGYKPSLPADVLEKGIVSYGSRARTRRLVHRLLQGEPTSVVMVGGSITWGQGASEKGKTDWGSVLAEWLRKSFPRANITYRNAAIPATPSSYMALCVNQHVAPDADLVLLEYNVNDGGAQKGDSPIRRAHERLMRKLLGYPHQPAVLEMVFARWLHPTEWNIFPVPYRTGGDEELGVLAQYYHLPWFSTRSLMWDKWAAKGAKEHPDFMNGPDHPNDLGHRYMADMVIAYLRHIVEDLGLRPYGQADMAVVDAPLPPPMLKDNLPQGRSTCMMQDEFKALAVEAKGFEWINENTVKKPKFGWVGNTTGATLTFELNTVIAPTQKELNVPTAAVIVFLQSYEQMGMAVVRCVSGCKCDPVQLQGAVDVHWSQNALAKMRMSAHKHCRVEVEILEQTKDPGRGHKVKIIGVILSETVGDESAGFEDELGVITVEFGGQGAARYMGDGD